MWSIFNAICILVGAINFLRFFSNLFSFIKRHYLRQPLDFARTYGKDSWVVVTGASDGIGAEYCRQLTRAGLNIVLISRTQSKLEAVEKQLKEIRPDVKTRIIQADFAENNNLAFYDKIFDQLKDLDISIFIANAGVMYVGKLWEVSLKRYQLMLDINTYQLALMTKKFETILQKRGKRSAIINVSSVAGIACTPIMSVYSATKGFVTFLGLSQTRELKGQKIDYQIWKPGQVLTNLAADSNFSEKALDEVKDKCVKVDDAVREILRSLGQEQITYGHKKHDIAGHSFEYVLTYLKTILLPFLAKEMQKAVN